MRDMRPRAFTLIEMLIVIAVILILATISVSVLAPMWTIADRVKCANNMRQMGVWLISTAIEKRGYPSGGPDPAAWGPGGSTYSTMMSSLRKSEIGICPGSEDDSPNRPAWAVCSYAYLGKLTPTYDCKCDDCKKGGSDSKPIWSLRWSGVLVTGGHNQGDETRFQSFPLATNLRFDGSKADAGESKTQATISDHQDLEKDRSQRALRAIPETPADHRSSLPLIVDIVVLTKLPAAAGTWQDAHRHISEAEQYEILYANHCNSSASTKGGWGINVLYTDQRVSWKEWDKMRFQVYSKSQGYYYFW